MPDTSPQSPTPPGSELDQRLLTLVGNLTEHDRLAMLTATRPPAYAAVDPVEPISELEGVSIPADVSVFPGRFSQPRSHYFVFAGHAVRIDEWGPRDVRAPHALWESRYMSLESRFPGPTLADATRYALDRISGYRDRGMRSAQLLSGAQVTFDGTTWQAPNPNHGTSLYEANAKFVAIAGWIENAQHILKRSELDAAELLTPAVLADSGPRMRQAADHIAAAIRHRAEQLQQLVADRHAGLQPSLLAGRPTRGLSRDAVYLHRLADGVSQRAQPDAAPGDYRVRFWNAIGRSLPPGKLHHVRSNLSEAQALADTYRPYNNTASRISQIVQQRFDGEIQQPAPTAYEQARQEAELEAALLAKPPNHTRSSANPAPDELLQPDSPLGASTDSEAAPGSAL